LGVSFAILCGLVSGSEATETAPRSHSVALDLEAITYIDEVRTADLNQSLANLNTPLITLIP
jgi:hypothetical protein